MGDWGWVGVEVDEAAVVEEGVVEEGVAEGDVDDVVAAAWSEDILMCSCQDFRLRLLWLQLGCIT